VTVGAAAFVSVRVRREMKRRANVKPVIGYLKAEHRLGRNYLEGRDDDRIDAGLAADRAADVSAIDDRRRRLCGNPRVKVTWVADGFSRGRV
jgi:hypothetical protein